MARAVRSLPTAKGVVLSIPPTGRTPSPGPVAGRKCLVWTSLWLDPVLPNRAPYFGQLAIPGHAPQTIYFASYAAVLWTECIAGRWEKARATLEHVVDFGRAQGIHVLFVFVPIKFRVYQPLVRFASDSPCRHWGVWPIVTLFAEFCHIAGAACVDLTAPLQEAVRAGDMPYPPVDTHWSPAGHALVAERLALELQQRAWLTTAPPAQ